MSRAQQVLRAVAAAYGLTSGELKGHRRYRGVVDARHVAMALCRRAGLSYTAVGRYFGGRHHTSALHGVRRGESLLARADVRGAAQDPAISGLAHLNIQIPTTPLFP